MTLAQAKRARTLAWKEYAATMPTASRIAARAKYDKACLNYRIAEWEESGGPAGNVPRPI